MEETCHVTPRDACGISHSAGWHSWSVSPAVVTFDPYRSDDPQPWLLVVLTYCRRRVTEEEFQGEGVQVTKGRSVNLPLFIQQASFRFLCARARLNQTE